MYKLDRIIINAAIAGLYSEYGYEVSEIYYGSYDKRLNIVNKLTKKYELSIHLIDDILFVDTVDKYLFSVDLIERFGDMLNLKVSVLEI